MLLSRLIQVKSPGDRRHAVSAEDESLGAALVEAASATGAEFPIMGGYSRIHLSEMVLGGVTRHVLAHRPLPLLTSH
jgi:nucleotide-binding universal stress UspA family protein